MPFSPAQSNAVKRAFQLLVPSPEWPVATIADIAALEPFSGFPPLPESAMNVDEQARRASVQLLTLAVSGDPRFQ